MKKSLGEQVAAFMAWRGWSVGDLVAEVRRKGAKTVKRQNIEGVLGGIDHPRYIQELAAAMDTTSDKLLAGQYVIPGGEPPDEKSIDLELVPGLIPIRKVKLKLQASVSGFSIEPENGDGPPIFFREDWMKARGYKARNLIAIKVRGASMETNLHDGDTVVINSADTDARDGFVFAINYEGEDVVKRVIRNEGKWWLFSDNPDKARYPTKECREGSCIIVGRVIHKQSEQI